VDKRFENQRGGICQEQKSNFFRNDQSGERMKEKSGNSISKLK